MAIRKAWADPSDGTMKQMICINHVSFRPWLQSSQAKGTHHAPAFAKSYTAEDFEHVSVCPGTDAIAYNQTLKLINMLTFSFFFFIL